MCSDAQRAQSALFVTGVVEQSAVSGVRSITNKTVNTFGSVGGIGMHEIVKRSSNGPVRGTNNIPHCAKNIVSDIVTGKPLHVFPN